MSIIPPKAIKKNPNGTYTATFRWRDGRIPRARQKTFSTERLAGEWYVQQRMNKERGIVYGNTNKVPVIDVLDQYTREVRKSERSRELEYYVIKSLKDFLKLKGITHVSQLSKADVADFERWRAKEYRERRNKDISQRTINIEIKMLMAALNHALDHDRIEHNPIARYRVKRDEAGFERFLEIDEIEAILHAAAPKGMFPAIYAMLTMGLRITEMRMMQLSDVQNDWLHIRSKTFTVDGREYSFTPKWEKPRWTPLDREYADDAYLRSCFSTSSRQIAFTKPSRRDLHPMGRRVAYDRIKAVIKDSGIQNWKEIKPHTLRHTHISYQVARIGHAKNISLRSIMEYVGIGDYQTMMRYSQNVKNLAKNMPHPEHSMPWQHPTTKLLHKYDIG